MRLGSHTKIGQPIGPIFVSSFILIVCVQWVKLECIVLELLVVLEGAPVGQRLEEVKIQIFFLAAGARLCFLF
jgi:hypothetical protein